MKDHRASGNVFVISRTTSLGGAACRTHSQRRELGTSAMHRGWVGTDGLGTGGFDKLGAVSTSADTFGGSGSECLLWNQQPRC